MLGGRGSGEGKGVLRSLMKRVRCDCCEGGGGCVDREAVHGMWLMQDLGMEEEEGGRGQEEGNKQLR